MGKVLFYQLKISKVECIVKTKHPQFRDRGHGGQTGFEHFRIANR